MRIHSRLAICGVVIFSALLVTGCMTTGHSKAFKIAKDSYEAQDWDGAMASILLALKEKPDSAKYVEFYKQLAPQFYDYHKSEAEAATGREDWDAAVMHYDSITEVDEIVVDMHLIGKDKQPVRVPIPEISSARASAAQKAATVHYARALHLKENKEWKPAAKEFRRASEFVNGYEDSLTLYDECRQLAIKRVAVIPFTESGGAVSHRGIGESLSDWVISMSMESSEQMEFLDLISRDQLSILLSEHNLGLTDLVDPGSVAKAGKMLGIHAVVVGKVTNVSTHYPPEITSTRSGSGTITETVYTKSGSYQVDRYVSCTVRFHTRSGKATVDATYQIIDVETARILKTGRYQGQVYEEYKSARYSGDEDALGYVSGARNMCDNPEVYPAPPEENIAKSVQQIARNFSDELTGFYND